LFTSELTCDMCHDQSSFAHNGFFSSFIVPASDFTTPRGTTVTVENVKTNEDSSLCLFCHRDDDPLKWRPVYGHSDNAVIDPMPRIHGVVRGGGSHYLGVDTDTFQGVNPKTDSWASDNTLAVSKYGTGSSVICESCHSILYNDGSIHPNAYGSIDRSQRGWWTNLLLKPYEDDSKGTGQAGSSIGADLCMGCHGESANQHHPLTDNIVSTTGAVLNTGAGSLADQTNAPSGEGAAPGTLSYPGVNMMDCDSCHRSHSADSNSDVPSGTRLSNGTVLGRPAYLLLEVSGPSNEWSSTLCLECHSK
jgi:hypothetical protein